MVFGQSNNDNGTNIIEMKPEPMKRQSLLDVMLYIKFELSDDDLK